MAHDVFISYSSKDKLIADAACAILESKGIRCWIAPRDILPGADWGESIVDALESRARFRAGVFVPCQRLATDPARGRTRSQSQAGRHSPPHRGRAPHQVARIFHQYAALARRLQSPARAAPELISPTSSATFSRAKSGHRTQAPRSHAPAVNRRPLLIGALALILAGAALAGAWRYMRTPAHHDAGALRRPPARSLLHSVRWTRRARRNLWSAAEHLFSTTPPSRSRFPEKEPPQSRVVFVNNLGLYEGRAVAPTVSRKFSDPDEHRQCARFFHAQFCQTNEKPDVHRA